MTCQRYKWLRAASCRQPLECTSFVDGRSSSSAQLLPYLYQYDAMLFWWQCVSHALNQLLPDGPVKRFAVNPTKQWCTHQQVDCRCASSELKEYYIWTSPLSIVATFCALIAVNYEKHSVLHSNSRLDRRLAGKPAEACLIITCSIIAKML